MFGRQGSSERREASNNLAYLYSVLLILVAMIGFLVAATLLNGVWRSLVYSFSSTVLPIGLISFLYEFRLRRTVETELLRLVGIERSLSSHHISSATDASRIDWGTILNEASHFRILLAEPGSWLQANWNLIVEGADERSIQVEFFFPNPEGAWFSQVADFYQVTTAYLAEDIERATRIVEDQWNIADEASALSRGSVLQVRYIDGFPSCSVIRADNTVVLTLFSSTSRPTTDSGFAVCFKGPKSAYPINRYEEELNRLSADTPLQFEKEVDARRNES